MSATREHCDLCGKPIFVRPMWLEAQISPFRFRLAAIKPSNSQGWFPFHPACAERALIRGAKNK